MKDGAKMETKVNQKNNHEVETMSKEKVAVGKQNDQESPRRGSGAEMPSSPKGCTVAI